MTKPAVSGLYVSQPSDLAHQVKIAATVGNFTVVECHCGESSPLCQNVGLAREWWREHAGLPALVADRSTTYAGD